MSSLHCKCLETRFIVCPLDSSFFFVKNEIFFHVLYVKKNTCKCAAYLNVKRRLFGS